MELKANQKKTLSDVLFILWAGGAALLSYSLVYALRKPFTAATFDGIDFLKNPPTAVEATTGEVHRRHHISPTGFYRGKKVIATKQDE